MERGKRPELGVEEGFLSAPLRLPPINFEKLKPWIGRIARVIPWIFGVALLAEIISFSVGQHGVLADGAYITLRYARNLALGNGLVYNPGVRYFGTGGPAFAVLLGVLGKIFGVSQIPLVAEMISNGSIAVTCVAMIVGFREERQPLIGFLAAPIYVLLHSTRAGVGFEVLPQMACIASAYVFYLRAWRNEKTALGASVLMAIATLLRPDAIIWMAPVLVHAVATRFNRRLITESDVSIQDRFRDFGRSIPFKEIGIVVTPVVVAAIACQIYFGALWPAALGTKIALSHTTQWHGYLSGGLSWIQRGWTTDGLPIIVLLWLAFLGVATVGYYAATKRDRFLELILAGVLLHSFAYSLTLPSYGWYYVPEGLGIAILAASVIAYCADAAKRISSYGAAVVLALAAVFGYQLIIYERYSVSAGQHVLETSDRIVVYHALSDWLKSNTTSTDTVGLCEPGLIGWESGRPIVDQFFLVTPGDNDSLRRHVFDNAFRTQHPSFIIESPLLFGSMRGHPWFWQNYEFIRSFPETRTEPLTESEADELRKMDRMEVDIWKLRGTLLDLKEASSLARDYVKSLDDSKTGSTSE